MNDPKLKLAMARLCDKIIHTANAPNEVGNFHWLGTPKEVLDPEWLYVMHLVEQTLSEDDQESYSHHLSQTVPQNYNAGPADEFGDDIMIHRDFDVLSATFNQRATAMCKVKGITP